MLGRDVYGKGIHHGEISVKIMKKGLILTTTPLISIKKGDTCIYLKRVICSLC
jgi:hypothetical protein